RATPRRVGFSMRLPASKRQSGDRVRARAACRVRALVTSRSRLQSWENLDTSYPRETEGNLRVWDKGTPRVNLRMVGSQNGIAYNVCRFSRLTRNPEFALISRACRASGAEKDD